jgi:hypothetical protein
MGPLFGPTPIIGIPEEKAIKLSVAIPLGETT